jgi:hypothetical protein
VNVIPDAVVVVVVVVLVVVIVVVLVVVALVVVVVVFVVTVVLVGGVGIWHRPSDRTPLPSSHDMHFSPGTLHSSPAGVGE